MKPSWIDRHLFGKDCVFFCIFVLAKGDFSDLHFNLTLRYFLCYFGVGIQNTWCIPNLKSTETLGSAFFKALCNGIHLIESNFSRVRLENELNRGQVNLRKMVGLPLTLVNSF